jgi:hypothetical protein
VDDKIIDKIRKLMNLSKSCNQGEAETAMAMAMKLMTLHNIEAQKIAEIEKKESDPFANYKSVKVIDLAVRTPTEFKFYYSVLAEFFFIKAVITRGVGVFFFGTPENIEMAKYVSDQLAATYRNLWYQYKSRTNAPTTAKRSFYAGLSRGLTNKLKEERGEIQREFGMVLVKDPYLDEAMSSYYKNLKKGAISKFTHDGAASNAGFSAGRNINIRQGIGGGSNNQRFLLS